MQSVFDANLKLDNLVIQKGGIQQRLVDYGYDNAGRLQTVQEISATATYSYVPNSPLVSRIVFTNGGTTRLTTVKDYDKLNRLKSINSSVNAATSPQFVHAYQYNAANQRTKLSLTNGAHWDYTYDALGQVTSGKKRWVDNAPVAGQQFEYAFDEIGNRLSTQAGGDASGGNLRYADYDVNHLNQYERRTVPAAMDVIGAAPAGSNVTVNSNSVERRGAYYRQELSIPNNSTSVWQTVNVDVAPLGSVDKTGKVFVPKSPEVFAQDADGNLTQDGRWDYTWDAENRLIKLASRTDAPTGSEKCLVFEYDYRGRRIGKKVWNGFDTTTGTLVLDERYLYDGWNLAAVINSSAALTKFFVWGPDLSGSMQGAGGVGGLLWGRMNGPAPRFAAYDGNGNVSALVNGITGAVDAQYEYGPFGELLRATGPLALANPFRFSTKYQDDETDQLYYGYRFYNPTTGRWLSRDPLGEKAGLHLYAFLSNAPTLDFDLGGGIAWNVFAKHAAECLKDLVKAGLLNSFTKKVNVGEACAQLPIESGKMGDSICKGSYEFPMAKGFITEPSTLGKEMMKCIFGKLSERVVKKLIDKAGDEILQDLLEKLRDEGTEGAMSLVDGTVDFQFMARATCRKGMPHVSIFGRTTVGIGQTIATVDSQPIAEGTCDGLANFFNVVNLKAVPCCCPSE